jgi:hypothetical protein
MAKDTNEQKLIKIREAEVDYKDCIRLYINNYFPTEYRFEARNILDKEDIYREISFSIIDKWAGREHTYKDAPDYTEYKKSFSAENYIEKIVPDEFKSLLDLKCTKHEFILKEFCEENSKIYKLGEGYRGFFTTFHINGKVVENPRDDKSSDLGNIYKIGDKSAHIISFQIIHRLIISKELFEEIFQFLRHERYSPDIINQPYDNSYSAGRYKKCLELVISPAEIPLGELSESQLSSEEYKRAYISADLENFRLELEMVDNTIGFVPETAIKTPDSVHENIKLIEDKLASLKSNQIPLSYPIIFCLILLLALTTYSIWF